MEQPVEIKKQVIKKTLKKEVDVDEDDKKKLQLEKDKFIGFIKNSAKYPLNADWKECLVCDRHVHKDYFVKVSGGGMESCFHCWAWLNCNGYDFESGVYNAHPNQNDIDLLLKRTYKLHDSNKCTNPECLLNKLNQMLGAKLLHPSLMEMLELSSNKQVSVNFNYKNKKIDVNYDESFIMI
jgi:hypothetical protein